MSRYTSSYSSAGVAVGSYDRPEQSVSTIMNNISKGGVQPDYAAQWAQYYRSQGMAREAEMIETYVRGKEAIRQEQERGSSSRGFERPRTPPSRNGGGSGYGTSECYRCNKIGHFARECPEFTGIRRPDPRDLRRDDRRDLRGDRRDYRDDRRDLRDDRRDLRDDRRDDRIRSRSPPRGGGSECYRCNRMGHFARECPEFTGLRRDNRGGEPRDSGPRREGGGGKDAAYGTSECYRCNKIGHFARECPSYTGLPHPGARREGGGGGGGGAGSREYGTSKCLKCNRYGHFARECREEENRCYKCHESGHIAKDCSKEDVCYVCNKEGHLAKDCPDGDKKTCYRCSGKGHIAMDCPSSQRELDRARKRDGVDEAKGDRVTDEDAEDL